MLSEKENGKNLIELCGAVIAALNNQNKGQVVQIIPNVPGNTSEAREIARAATGIEQQVERMSKAYPKLLQNVGTAAGFAALKKTVEEDRAALKKKIAAIDKLELGNRPIDDIQGAFNTPDVVLFIDQVHELSENFDSLSENFNQLASNAKTAKQVVKSVSTQEMQTLSGLEEQLTAHAAKLPEKLKSALKTNTPVKSLVEEMKQEWDGTESEFKDLKKRVFLLESSPEGKIATLQAAVTNSADAMQAVLRTCGLEELGGLQQQLEGKLGLPEIRKVADSFQSFDNRLAKAKKEIEEFKEKAVQIDGIIDSSEKAKKKLDAVAPQCTKLLTEIVGDISNLKQAALAVQKGDFKSIVEKVQSYEDSMKAINTSLQKAIEDIKAAGSGVHEIVGIDAEDLANLEALAKNAADDYEKKASELFKRENKKLREVKKAVRDVRKIGENLHDLLAIKKEIYEGFSKVLAGFNQVREGVNEHNPDKVIGGLTQAYQGLVLLAGAVKKLRGIISKIQQKTYGIVEWSTRTVFKGGGRAMAYLGDEEIQDKDEFKEHIKAIKAHLIKDYKTNIAKGKWWDGSGGIPGLHSHDFVATKEIKEFLKSQSKDTGLSIESLAGNMFDAIYEKEKGSIMESLAADVVNATGKAELEQANLSTDRKAHAEKILGDLHTPKAGPSPDH